jgi:serine/threonine protein kinase
MSSDDLIDVDHTKPPFDQIKGVRWLGAARSGHRSFAHARHHLYVGRHSPSRSNVLVKLSAKPGLVYQQDLNNEIASLTTINRELPKSRHFPLLLDQGRLGDGRVYLVIPLFDELPLANAIGPDPAPEKLVTHLRTALEIARALIDLHALEIFHVDLNPMNVLYRTEKGAPVIRVVDFESSYERARHGAGEFYSPAVTPGYSAPELSRQPPDARADVFSLGAVLYALVAGYQRKWDVDPSGCLASDLDVEPDLKTILASAVDPRPEKRYPSMLRFREALGAYLERIWPGRGW